MVVKVIINFVYSICKKTPSTKGIPLPTMIHISALTTLGLFYLLPCLTFAIVDKWTPEDFYWDGAFINSSIPSDLSMRADEAPGTTDLTNLPMTSNGESSVQIVSIAAFFVPGELLRLR